MSVQSLEECEIRLYPSVYSSHRWTHKPTSLCLATLRALYHVDPLVTCSHFPPPTSAGSKFGPNLISSYFQFSTGTLWEKKKEKQKMNKLSSDSLN